MCSKNMGKDIQHCETGRMDFIGMPFPGFPFLAFLQAYGLPCFLLIED